MYRRVSVRCIATVAALVMGLINTPALADTFTCTSVCNFGPGDVLDNLNVKNGGVATLDGMRVTGSIVVEDGGVLFLVNGVAVDGNVQSFGGAETSVTDSAVGGSIQIKNTPLIVVEASTMEGDLQLEENNATFAATLILSNVIGGNLQLYKNSFAGYEVQLSFNEVYGNLQLVDNRGGTIVVSDNFVEGALECPDNESEITGSGNDVGDLECAYLQEGTQPDGGMDQGTGSDTPDGGSAGGGEVVDDDGANVSDDFGDDVIGDDALRSIDVCGAGSGGAVALLTLGWLMFSGCWMTSPRTRRR